MAVHTVADSQLKTRSCQYKQGGQLSCCTAISVCIHITVVIAALLYVCGEPVTSALILLCVITIIIIIIIIIIITTTIFVILQLQAMCLLYVHQLQWP